MARIYSGWDNIKHDDEVTPWNEKNEQKIINWMEELS
jgi:hypothetical protein